MKKVWAIIYAILFLETFTEYLKKTHYSLRRTCVFIVNFNQFSLSIDFMDK